MSRESSHPSIPSHLHWNERKERNGRYFGGPSSRQRPATFFLLPVVWLFGCFVADAGPRFSCEIEHETSTRQRYNDTTIQNVRYSSSALFIVTGSLTSNFISLTFACLGFRPYSSHIILSRYLTITQSAIQPYVCRLPSSYHPHRISPSRSSN